MTSMVPSLDEEALAWLVTLSEAGDPAPCYVTRDSAPAIPVELDLIAAARTYLPLLVAEVRRLRDS